jgi:hypothetical protein
LVRPASLEVRAPSKEYLRDQPASPFAHVLNNLPSASRVSPSPIACWFTLREGQPFPSPRLFTGRTRWRIENETYNTLKNQGYHFEHNYGHGYKNLCVVLALLMMAAFLIDQIQQRCNKRFKQAHEKAGPKCALWEAIRHLFYSFKVGSMREIDEAIAFGYERPRLQQLITQARGEVGALDSS